MECNSKIITCNKEGDSIINKAVLARDHNKGDTVRNKDLEEIGGIKKNFRNKMMYDIDIYVL